MSEDKRHSDEISIIDIIAIIIKRKRVIFCLAILAGILSVLFSLGSIFLPAEKSYLPNIYTAKAAIFISNGSSSGLSTALAASGLGGIASLAGVDVGSTSTGNLAVYFAKTPSSLDELNEEFNLSRRYRVKKNIKTRTRESILSNLSVIFDEKTGIVDIAFTDWDPEFARDVTNRLVEILDRRFATLGGNKAKAQKLILEQKLGDVQNQILRIEGEIKNFQSKYGVLSIEALASEQIGVLARLRSELILKDMEIGSYEQFSRIEDPVIRRLRSERESIQKKISELERGGSVLPSQRNIPELAFKYAAMQRDMLVQTEMFKILTQQYELAKLNSDGQDSTFQVIELADIPDKKTGPSRGIICVVIVIGSIALALVGALLAEIIVRIKNDPEMLARLRGSEI